jgi:hypothetical protein
VARILNARELAINAGTQDGVTVGMQFDILDPKGEDVLDPDTKEIIGSLSRPKVRVQVTEVQERLSVARTFKKQKVNIGGRGPSLGDFSALQRALLPPKWVTVYETLHTDEQTWEDLDEEKSYVKTGDPAVQVLGDLEEA